MSAARPYQPLADYGVIGDFRTAVLVSRDGSIDWACLPRFDSPSVFGRIIDRHAGGFWQLAPHGDHVSAELRYVDDTAILETVHESAGGTARVTDLMVPPSQGDGPCILVRTCEGLAGSISLNSTFEPAFGYGGEPARIEPFGENGLLASAPNGPELRLVSTVDQRDREAVVALAPGERATFVLAVGGEPPRLAEAEAAAEQAAGWWRSWCKGVEYSGPYRDQVVRSAIVLKLLSHSPTGAMVAAPTTSLPEVVGGERNWDYRYTWLRDSSLSLYAWYAIGLRAEGDAFFDWICERVGDPEVESAGLKVMYDLDGGSDHAEHELERLEGYRESRPVRIGNAACEQVQLDVYGDVLDCFASACAWGRSDKLELWSRYSVLADWICEHWQEPDHGVWELRDRPRHYVHSKVMAWVALDRALRAGREHDLTGAFAHWEASAQAIRTTVLDRGWNGELGAFRQALDEDALDAATLLLPLVGFLPADDPRAIANLKRIQAELGAGELVYRFAPELSAPEGAFGVCTFWLVNALAHAGRHDSAVEVLERMLSRAEPLGLFSEEIDPGTGELLGNLPQCFVHAGFITAAVNLARAAGVGEAPASHDAPVGTAHLVPIPENGKAA